MVFLIPFSTQTAPLSKVLFRWTPSSQIQSQLVQYSHEKSLSERIRKAINLVHKLPETALLIRETKQTVSPLQKLSKIALHVHQLFQWTVDRLKFIESNLSATQHLAITKDLGNSFFVPGASMLSLPEKQCSVDSSPLFSQWVSLKVNPQKIANHLFELVKLDLAIYRKVYWSRLLKLLKKDSNSSLSQPGIIFLAEHLKTMFPNSETLESARVLQMGHQKKYHLLKELRKVGIATPRDFLTQWFSIAGYCFPVQP